MRDSLSKVERSVKKSPNIRDEISESSLTEIEEELNQLGES